MRGFFDTSEVIEIKTFIGANSLWRHDFEVKRTKRNAATSASGLRLIEARLSDDSDEDIR